MYSTLNFAGLASSYSTLLPLFPMAATIQVILSQHNFTSPTVFSSISSFILFGSGLEQTLNLHNLVFFFFFLLFPLIHHHAVCSGKLCNLRVNEECFEIALVFDYFLFPNWGVLYLETKSGDGYPALTFVCPRCCNPIGRKWGPWAWHQGTFTPASAKAQMDNLSVVLFCTYGLFWLSVTHLNC